MTALLDAEIPDALLPDKEWARRYREGKATLAALLVSAKSLAAAGHRVHVLRRGARDYGAWAGVVWEHFLRFDGVGPTPSGAYRIHTFGPASRKRRAYR
jgi:hypothetical protein